MKGDLVAVSTENGVNESYRFMCFLNHSVRAGDLFRNFTPSPMLLNLDMRGKECIKGSMSTSRVVMFSLACFTGSARTLIADCMECSCVGGEDNWKGQLSVASSSVDFNPAL